MVIKMIDLLKLLIGFLIDPVKKRKRKKILNPLEVKEVKDDQVMRIRYFSWKSRGDVRIIELEQGPEHLGNFKPILLNAIRKYTKMEPSFSNSETSKFEFVYELRRDFNSKWRLIGETDGSTLSQQFLVILLHN